MAPEAGKGFRVRHDLASVPPMLILAFAAAAAAAPVPHPSPLKTFHDWIVGCDNGRACHAVALLPEDGEGGVTMAVRRGPEGGAQPQVDFTLDGAGAVGLAADGKKLNVRLKPASDGAIVAAEDVPAVIAALRSARSLTLLDAKGAPLGAVSLAGASAALLYMDDQQKRVGTVTALARPGPQPASAVPAPPPIPVVRSASVAAGPAMNLNATQVAAMRRREGCMIEEVGGPVFLEKHRLDAKRTLVLLGCGSGAYNMSVVPLIAEGSGRDVRINVAPFDNAGADKPMLTNADWDEKSGLLSSYAKGRGLGDCGVSQHYAWDGSRFRLVTQEEMSECRGSIDYITTWRAEVR